MDRLGIMIVQTCQRRAQAGIDVEVLGRTWLGTVIVTLRGIAALSHYSQCLAETTKLAY